MVVEEKQRGAADRDDGADDSRSKAAERGGKGDDADEQRCRVRNDNEMAVDNDGDDLWFDAFVADFLRTTFLAAPLRPLTVLAISILPIERA